MKKSGLAKKQAMKITGQMQQPGSAAPFGQVAPVALEHAPVCLYRGYPSGSGGP